MKKFSSLFWIILALSLLSLLSLSRISYSQSDKPFLVSDPNPGASEYEITIPGTTFDKFHSPAANDGSVNFDISGIAPGSYSGATITTCGRYTLNGEPQEALNCAPEWTTPFSLGVPSASAASGMAVERK